MAVWPLIAESQKTRLPLLPAWSGVAIYDGPPLTGDTPVEYLTLGYVLGEDYGGTFEQAEGPGPFMEEVGQLRSELVVASGESDVLPALRARAFALTDAWAAAIRADQTLGGVTQPSSTASLSVDIQPVQTRTGGVVQRLTVTLNYSARTVNP